MKQNFKIALLSLFLVVVIASAFTVQGKETVSIQTPVTSGLYWYDGSGNFIIQNETSAEMGRLQTLYPNSSFNTDGSAGVAFEFGRQTQSPSGTLVTTIYKVN